MTPAFDSGDVRRYYDRHTPAFLSRGQSGSAGAIHRAVWGPGVTTRGEAFRFVENRIAEAVQGLPASSERLHVVDLGCGVGASLCFLAGRLPIRGTGITVSPVQVQIARQRIADARLADRVRCIEGDYSDLPASLAPADLAYAIESFVHAEEPGRFFTQCQRLIRPGGLLVICDDFRRAVEDPEAIRTIERFCRGWHVNNLLDRDELRSLAHAHGFEHQSTADLSTYLELRRLRDRLVDVVLALARFTSVEQSRVDYLAGGSALQRCLSRGWIGYDLAIFKKLEDVRI